MISVDVRFFEELNDFLPQFMRKVWIRRVVHSGTNVKDLVESMGVPHTEIDLIQVNSRSVSFGYRLQEGDRVTVYPMFESIDISGLTLLRPNPLREIRFVLDVHLGRLTVMLRLHGFDTLYRNDYSDEELAEISANERRILLTRDRGLLKRKKITYGCLIRDDHPVKQLIQVYHRFDLFASAKPFSRCPKCNGLLKSVSKKAVEAQLKPMTRKNVRSFRQCVSCGKIYWKGAHFQNIKKITELFSGEPFKSDRLEN